MGKINTLEELRKDNKSARLVDLNVFANALQLYCQATINIQANGAICAHPRTGTPMENPYLNIQMKYGAIIKKMRLIKADRVMDLLMKESAQSSSGAS